LARFNFSFVNETGRPEIADERSEVVAEKDVFGFEVPVKNQTFVQVGKRMRNAIKDNRKMNQLEAVRIAAAPFEVVGNVIERPVRTEREHKDRAMLAIRRAETPCQDGEDRRMEDLERDEGFAQEGDLVIETMKRRDALDGNGLAVREARALVNIGRTPPAKIFPFFVVSWIH
jgi:hypothetical protein